MIVTRLSPAADTPKAVLDSIEDIEESSEDIRSVCLQFSDQSLDVCRKAMIAARDHQGVSH
jgi:hypothetical protein